MTRLVCILVGFYNVLFAFPAVSGLMVYLTRLFQPSRNFPLWLLFVPLLMIVLVHSVRLALLKETARRAQVGLSATVFVLRLLNALALLPAMLSRPEWARRLPALVVILLLGLLLDAATFWASRSRWAAKAFS